MPTAPPAGRARPLFLLTRSTAILDLAAMGPEETIILCPANHSPPIRVAPYPGAPGYEAVATCLASPEVRARTAGLIAWRPKSLSATASGRGTSVTGIKACGFAFMVQGPSEDTSPFA